MTTEIKVAYTITGKIGGKPIECGNLGRDSANKLKDGLFNDNKGQFVTDDIIVILNHDKNTKRYFKPTKDALVQCKSYAWAITKDYMPQEGAKEGTNGNAKGLIGPRFGLPLTFDEIVKHPKAQQFRMLTDDNEVLYEGVFVDEYDRYTGFEPKDDFGEPNAGCTDIEYKEGRVWKPL